MKPFTYLHTGARFREPRCVAACATLIFVACFCGCGPDTTCNELLKACDSCDLASIESIVARQRTNINCRDSSGRTPLMFAAQCSDSRTVRSLLDAGAQVHFVDSHGLSALSYAMEGRNTVAIRALLAAGANARLRDRNGHTMLMTALAAGCGPEVLDLLLDQGCGPNDIGSDGLTPLCVATIKNNHSGAEWLLAHGAGIDAGPFGLTPLAIACGSGGRPADIKMVRLLIAHGAEAERKRDPGISVLESVNASHLDPQAKAEVIQILEESIRNRKASDAHP